MFLKAGRIEVWIERTQPWSRLDAWCIPDAVHVVGLSLLVIISRRPRWTQRTEKPLGMPY